MGSLHFVNLPCYSMGKRLENLGGGQTDGQTDGQTVRQTDRQTDRQKDKQTDGSTDRRIEIHPCV